MSDTEDESSSDDIEVYFDGGKDKDDTGLVSYGVSIQKDGDVIDEENGIVNYKEETPHVGEYFGVIKALEYVQNNYSEQEVSIYGDSQLIVNQVNDEFNVSAEHLKSLCTEAQELMKEVNVTLSEVDNAKNNEADRLAGEAVEEHKDSSEGGMWRAVIRRGESTPIESRTYAEDLDELREKIIKRIDDLNEDKDETS